MPRQPNFDLSIVIKFMKSNKRPTLTTELHQFLRDKGIVNLQHRSIIIKRLIDLTLIERVFGTKMLRLVRQKQRIV